MSFYALVNGQPSPAAPGAVGSCPECHTEMVAKCGDIMAHHWAHRPGSDCSYDNDGESGWHLWWKWQFHHAGGQIEVTRRAENGRVHRADAITAAGLVVEMQHDYQQVGDIASRENTYGRMVWIYDAGRFVDRLRWSRDGDEIRFSWRSPARSLTHHHAPVLWHVGDDVWCVSSVLMGRNGNEWNATGTAYHLGPAIDLADKIDWLTLSAPEMIVDDEGGRAVARILAMPRCSSCGRPMTCGQPGLHYVCQWALEPAS